MADKNESLYREVEDILKSVAKTKNFENYEVLLDRKRLQGDGFLSDFFTGKVLNKVTGETIAVAIKKAPVNATSALSHELIYRNELFFYSKCFPELDEFQKKKKVGKIVDNIPKFLLGNANSTEMFIAMEDLKAAGYSLFDKTAYFNREHLETIFKTYGKFHALSFVFKHENTENWEKLQENFSDEFPKRVFSNTMIQDVKQSFMSAVKNFDPATEADSLTKLKKFAKNFKETVTSVMNYKGDYSCLVHGDCWSNNMMFKYKESKELEDIKLLDFQVPRFTTPIHDLSYFFYSGAAKGDMDKIHNYLDLYHRSFTDFARELGCEEELLPLDVLKKEWKQYAFFGVFVGCHIWIFKLMEKNKIAELINNMDLTAENQVEGCEEKYRDIREGKEFKERTKSILLHAIEYGIIT